MELAAEPFDRSGFQTSFLATQREFNVINIMTAEQTTLRMVLATISKMGAQLLFPILAVHVNETYITRKRGIALGLCTTFSRFGAITAPTLVNLVSLAE